MSKLLKIEPRVPRAPRKSTKPRTYVHLTIRPLLSGGPEHDESCIVIGAPGSDRLAKNLAAFRRRYPAEQFRFLQD